MSAYVRVLSGSGIGEAVGVEKNKGKEKDAHLI